MLAKKSPGNSPSPFFRPLTAALVLAVAVTSFGGCRLCCDSEDAAYPAYGGVWQRTHRYSGRVGSVFDPGGARRRDLIDRDVPQEKNDSRSNIIPEGSPEPGALDEERPEGDELMPPKSRDESEKEFQERLRKFQEEKMLKAQVIPGDPAPPAFR